MSPSPDGTWHLSHNGSTARSHNLLPGRSDDSRCVSQEGYPNPWFKPLDDEDENSRGAILLKFPCVQSVAGVSAWFKNIIDIPDKEYRIKCKSGSFSARIVCRTKTPCQQFVVQQKDDRLQCVVDSIFAMQRRPIRVIQSKSEDARRVRRRFAPRLRNVFTNNADIVPTVDFRTETHSIADKKQWSLPPSF